MTPRERARAVLAEHPDAREDLLTLHIHRAELAAREDAIRDERRRIASKVLDRLGLG